MGQHTYSARLALLLVPGSQGHTNIARRADGSWTNFNLSVYRPLKSRLDIRAYSVSEHELGHSSCSHFGGLRLPASIKDTVLTLDSMTVVKVNDSSRTVPRIQQECRRPINVKGCMRQNKSQPETAGKWRQRRETGA